VRARPSFQPASLILYLLSAVIEVPVIVIRVLIIAFVSLPFLIAGGPTLPNNILLLLAVTPTVWSLMALITPAGSGWWWRQHTGGRDPSQREQFAYQDAVEHLQAHTPQPLPLPGSWFVVDEQQPDAAVCGDSLMLSRGLLESEYLPAVLAHELGHLATLDGRLTAALNRLVLHQAPRPKAQDPENPNQERLGVVDIVTSVPSTPKAINVLTGLFIFSWAARRLLSIARGGMALRLTAPAWGRYWRTREYTADQYAAGLGQANELADFLEIHALIHDHPIPFIALTEHTHPPTELRIDQLRNHNYEPITNDALPATV
jgi:Zn-dependent protease with chaperone function